MQTFLNRYDTTAATDDLDPLRLGEAAPDGDHLLEDFSGLWNLTDSPPPKQAPRRPPPPSTLSRRHLSNTSATGESMTQVSETETASSIHRRSGSVISAVSSEGGGGNGDDASRTSQKRRRTSGAAVETSSSSYPGFQPLARVPETKDQGDVRQPYMVEVQDHDVVLGDTHEPTWGTKIYREVRKPYAKKTLDNEQLKLVKTEFQRRLEKEMGRKLGCPPTFWANKEYTNKIKQYQVAGYLKNRPGITYAYAKDQAIKEDIKNASARSRTRSTKVFNCKGSLVSAIEKAMQTAEEWVGDDVDKELYAKNFREDLKRMAPWHGMYMHKKEDCERRARAEPEMKGTHMREARIHETHANHLETAMVDMINQMGNLMVESHRTANKKTPGAAGTIKSSGSVDGSASYTSSKDPVSSSTTARCKPPLGIRSLPERCNNASRARGGISARPRPQRRADGNNTVASSTLSGGAYDDRVAMEEDGNGSVEMDVSPISVRKAMLTENLGQTFVMPGIVATDEKATNKKELEVMFNTLRMGTGDDVPREVDQEAPDELSVLSIPNDDVSVLLEARELVIRRGIDQPAALPRAGHVADLTKAWSNGKREGRKEDTK